jgi:hypothetical protein
LAHCIESGENRLTLESLFAELLADTLGDADDLAIRPDRPV